MRWCWSADRLQAKLGPAFCLALDSETIDIGEHPRAEIVAKMSLTERQLQRDVLRIEALSLLDRQPPHGAVAAQRHVLNSD